MSNQEQIMLEEILNDEEVMNAAEESFKRMVEEDTRNDKHQ